MTLEIYKKRRKFVISSDKNIIMFLKYILFKDFLIK